MQDGTIYYISPLIPLILCYSDIGYNVRSQQPETIVNALKVASDHLRAVCSLNRAQPSADDTNQMATKNCLAPQPGDLAGQVMFPPS